MDTPFAVFVIAEKDGLIAAVTRDDGQFALPGGTVEQNESPYDAVCRESIEEGWSIQIDQIHFHEDYVDNRLIWWYKGKNPVKLTHFLESNRLQTGFVSKETIYNSGFKNDEAMLIYEQKKICEKDYLEYFTTTQPSSPTMINFVDTLSKEERDYWLLLADTYYGI